MNYIDPNTDFEAYAASYIEGVLSELSEYARQIETGDYDETPTTEYGGELDEYGLELVVEIGRPVTWLLGCGGPTTYIEWDAMYPRDGKITHNWAGKVLTANVPARVSGFLFDYLAEPVIEAKTSGF